MKTYFYSILVLLLVGSTASDIAAQDIEKLLAERDSIYNANVRKSRIDGVYIPKDLEDAFVELDRLSGAPQKQSFKMAEEDVVAKKLFFGVGRWMSVNWHFNDGSRFVKVLKGYGIHYPDDMIDFMLRAYHRHLNGLPIKAEESGAMYKKKRETLRAAKKANLEVVEETILRKNTATKQ